MSSRTASAAAQSAVARLGRGKAALALELVGYDADLGAAMKYAFGNAFVCKASPPPYLGPLNFKHGRHRVCMLAAVWPLSER